MKRILSCALVGVMCLGCVGCDSQEAEVEIQTTAVAEGTASDVTAQTLSAINDQVDYLLEDQFSGKDYEIGCVFDSYIAITLADGASSCNDSSVEISGDVITITQEGSYTLEGTLSNGQIVIDAPDDAKVQLALNGVSISNDQSAAIYTLSADKVFVTTERGTVNTLTANLVEDTSADTNVDAALFAKTDLTLNGEGTLKVLSTNGNGITSKDDLAITSGDYVISADGHGLEANNSIRVAGGTFDIVAGKDGLHAEHDEDATLGYIYIANGTMTIDAQGDGMDSSSYLEIEDGTFDVTAGGGYENAVVSTSTQGMMGGQMGMPRTQPGTTTTGTDTTQVPEMGTREAQMGTEMVQGQQSNMGMSGPGGMTQPSMTGTMPEIEGELPEMDTTMMGGRGEMTQPDMATGELPEMDTTMMGGREDMMGQSAMTGQMPGMTQPGMEAITATAEEADTTLSTKGIKAELGITIFGGAITLNTADDAIHSNGNVQIIDGTFYIESGDDGVRAELTTDILGGTIYLAVCYEGLEGHVVNVAGGKIEIYSSDDGINAVRSTLAEADMEVAIYISGGSLYIDSENEGDGFDSNGYIYVSGGDVLISATTVTTDTSLDYGITGTITGGTFIATGSTSRTRQNFDENSTQGSILFDLDSVQSGSVTLTNSQGEVLVDIVPVKDYQTIHISMPELEVGETYTLVAGTETHTIELESLLYGENADTGPGVGMQGGMSQGGGMSMGGRR